MKKIEFESEEQAGEFLKEIFPLLKIRSMSFRSDEIDIPKTVENIKQKGYIKKSSLEMASKEFHDKHAFNSDPKHNTSIETYNYITELKKEIERLKKPVEKPIGLKSCDNCRYEKIPAHGHPCGRCRNYEGWEPKQ